MGQLIVRQIDDELIRRLKVRAAKRGHSAEAEHREILREALQGRTTRETLKDVLLRMPAGGNDADFDRPKDRGRRVRL